MGVSRTEAAEVAARWPQAARHGQTFLTVNNALNNLLGHPRQWNTLSAYIRATDQEVAGAMMRWREDNHREGGRKRHFDTLM